MDLAISRAPLSTSGVWFRPGSFLSRASVHGGNLAGARTVNRQTSTRSETISKTENRTNVMSTVEFSSDLTASYARKMVELESRGNGDQLNALERVARHCGLGSRALRRLINGETKEPSINVFGRVRAAYLDLCERHITKLQYEVDTDKVRYGDAAFADLDREIQTLAEKVRRAKGR